MNGKTAATVVFLLLSIIITPSMSSGSHYEKDRWVDEYDDMTGINRTLDGGNTTVVVEDGSVSPGFSSSVSFESDENTVILYHFNDGAGTEIKDSGPYGIDAVGVNTDDTNWVTGVEGTALKFNGVDEYAYAPYDERFNLGAPLTVEAWIKLDNHPSDASCWGFVVTKRSGYYMTPKHFTVDVPYVVHATGYEVEIGSWYYLAGSYDGNHVKFYINGELMESTECSEEMRRYSRPLTMGASEGGGFYFMNGSIDEVRISDTARDADEIASHWEKYNQSRNANRYPDSGYYTEDISLPDRSYWESLSATGTIPEGTSRTIRVMDPDSGEIIGGLSTTGDTIDLSELDPFRYSSIRMNVLFTSTEEAFPTLDALEVSFRENTPPSVSGLVSPEIMVRGGTHWIEFDLTDPDQDLSSLNVTFEIRSDDWIEITPVSTEPTGSGYNLTFSSGPDWTLGPYDLRITAVDEMGEGSNLTVFDGVYISPESGVTIALDRSGIPIYRGDPHDFRVIPGSEIPFKDTDLVIKCMREEVHIPWISGFRKQQRDWTATITAPMDARTGPLDILLNISIDGGDTFDVEFEEAFLVQNTPPLFHSVPALARDEDSSPGLLLDLEEYIEDPDTGMEDIEVQLVSVNPPGWVEISILDKELHLLGLAPDWNGEVVIAVNVLDGVNEVTGNITLEIVPVQDAPVIEPFENLTCMEGETLVHRFRASDPDKDDELIFSIETEDNDLYRWTDIDLNPSNGSFVLMAGTGSHGTYDCLLTVSDGIDSVQREFTIDITAVNTPPRWIRVGSEYVYNDRVTIYVEEGRTESMYLDFSDDITDREELMLYMTNAPDFIYISGGHLLIEPTDEHVGTWNINMILSDGEFETILEVNLEVILVDDPPVAVITYSSNKVEEGKSVTLSAEETTDPDTPLEDLEYEWYSDIDGYLGSGIEIEPVLSLGSHLISLEVSDTEGTSRDTVRIVVEEKESRLSIPIIIYIAVLLSVVVFISAITIFTVILWRKLDPDDIEENYQRDQAALSREK